MKPLTGSPLKSTGFKRLINGLFRSRLLRLFFTLILAFIGMGGVSRSPGFLERVGTWPDFGRGPALDVAVSGQYAYVAIGEGGLLILDITDLTQPRRVGSYLPAGRAEQVQIVGSLAYLIAQVHRGGGCKNWGWGPGGRGLLVILDLSNPIQPAQLGSYMTTSPVTGFSVEGDQVYLGTTDGDHGDASFRILDVSNPTRPEQLYVDHTLDTDTLSVDGDRAYVFSDRENQLSILDVSQPASPKETANFSEILTPFGAKRLKSANRRLYVLRYGLTIYDMGDPSAPEILGKLEYPNWEWGPDIEIVDDYVYMTGDERGLYVVDVSDPSRPIVMETLYISGGAGRLEVSGANALIIDNKNRLRIIDIRDPGNLVQTAIYDTGLAPQAMRLSGNKAYLLSSVEDGEGGSRIEVVDLSTPTQPELLGVFNSDRRITSLDVENDLVYIHEEGSGLQILDFRHPNQPILRSDTTVNAEHRPPESGSGGRSILDGNTYFGMGWDGFRVINSHNITQAEYDTLGEVNGLTAKGQYLYVAEGWEGIEVFDISDPKQPLPIGNAKTRGQALSVTVSGEYLYVFEGAGGLSIFRLPSESVTIVEHPTGVNVAAGDSVTLTVRAYGGGTLDYQWYQGESRDLSRPIKGGNGPTFTTPPLTEPTAYWVRINSGNSVNDSQTARINLVPPVIVELLGSWPSEWNDRDGPGSAVDVAVSGQYAFLADSDGGLRILDVSDPAQPSMVGSYRSNARRVAANGNIVYLESDTFQVLDIRDPAHPTQIEDFTENDGEFFLTKKFAYQQSGGGLTRLDRQIADSPPVGMANEEMSVDETYAAIAQRWGGFRIIDQSNPTELRWGATYYSDAPTLDVAWQDNVACVILGDDLPGVELVDMTDPQHPTRLARIVLPRVRVNNVAITGSYACVTGARLWIYDFSDPDQLVRVGSRRLGGEMYGIEVIGDMAFVAAGLQGLLIYRLTPQLLPLGRISDLTTLNLSGNDLTDVSFLERLTSLTELDLSRNQLTDVSFLEGLTSLTELDLSRNQLTDVSFLEGLTSLAKLNLSHNQLTNLTLPESLTSLTELWLWNNRLTSLTLPGGLTNLTSLDLSENRLTSLTLPEGLTSLIWLDIRNNRLLTSLTLPEELTSLTSLDLSRNQLTGLTLPESLTSLATLDLAGNPVLTGLTLPEGLTSLTTLDLNGNRVLTSLTLPEGFTNLTMLDLRGSSITTLNVPVGLNIDDLELPGFDKSNVTFYIPLTVKLVSDKVEVDWTQGILQSTDAIEGAWTDIDGATSPYQVEPIQSQRFFRVKTE